MVASADRGAVAGIVCPDGNHVAVIVSCSHDRQTVVDGAILLKPKPRPLAVANYPAISTKVDNPLSP